MEKKATNLGYQVPTLRPGEKFSYGQLETSAARVWQDSLGEEQEQQILDGYITKDQIKDVETVLKSKEIDLTQCDAAFKLYPISGLVNNEWSDDAFTKDLMKMFGQWSFQDPRGNPQQVFGPNTETITFIPYDLETQLQLVEGSIPQETWISYLVSTGLLSNGLGQDILRRYIARRLLGCFFDRSKGGPSKQYKNEYIVRRQEVYAAQKAVDDADKMEAEKVNTVGYTTKQELSDYEANFGMTLDQSLSLLQDYISPYPLTFLLQPIAGDGACLYRSLACSLFKMITSINLGNGVDFNSNVLSNKPGLQGQDPWITDNQYYNVDSFRSAILNGITKWIKFYVYILLCTSIPTDQVSYISGITGVSWIVPVTDIKELILNPIQSLERMGVETLVDKLYIPSLDLIVRFSLWLYATMTTGGSPNSFTWDQVKYWFFILLAIPWNHPLFNSIDGAYVPEKTFHIWEIFNSRWGRQSLDLTLEGIDEYKRSESTIRGNALITTPALKTTAYKTFSTLFKRLGTFGGESEVVVFSSLFYGSPLPFKKVIIYVSKVLEQGGSVDHKLIVPNYRAIDSQGEIYKFDFTSEISVYYSPSHYQSLFPLALPLLSVSALADIVSIPNVPLGFPIIIVPPIFTGIMQPPKLGPFIPTFQPKVPTLPPTVPTFGPSVSSKLPSAFKPVGHAKLQPETPFRAPVSTKLPPTTPFVPLLSPKLPSTSPFNPYRPPTKIPVITTATRPKIVPKTIIRPGRATPKSQIPSITPATRPYTGFNPSNVPNVPSIPNIPRVSTATTSPISSFGTITSYPSPSIYSKGPSSGYTGGYGTSTSGFGGTTRASQEQYDLTSSILNRLISEYSDLIASGQIYPEEIYNLFKSESSGLGISGPTINSVWRNYELSRLYTPPL